MAEEKSVKLVFSDGSPEVSLPVLPGSVGPEVIDISTLYKKTGKFTYDPGFMSTASCKSAITYIDGAAGKLLYRGYPIEELARNCDYLEVCYLLLKGELPNAKEKEDFEYLVMHHTLIHESMHLFLQGFRRDAHPMAVLTGLIGAMSAFYPKSCNLLDPEQRAMAAVQLIGKMPGLVAMTYKYSVGEPYIYPRNDLSYSANFMRMMFAIPCEEYKINDVLTRAIDRIFILHADHEQNASTSTVRLCASSGTSPFAAIAAGVACLWGPQHGGANEATLSMLYHIQEEGGIAKIGDFIKKELDDYMHIHLDVVEVMQQKIQEAEKERKAIAGITKIAREKAKKVNLHNKKLRDCRIHLNDAKGDRREESSIFITEGNSASGSITKSRDVDTQAVFSLRGKPLNCYGKTKRLVYENEEFNLLQAALNIEDGIEGLRYNRVIVATDADVDGMHIRLLMITFFLQFFPELIKKGHVYILQTPLFRVRNVKRGKTVYCYSDAERAKAIDELSPNAEITRFKGLGEISPEEFTHFIGPDMRLDQVMMRKTDAVGDLLGYYMGDNTRERQDFIIENLVVEEDKVV